jgi:hypothetical protein
MNSCSRYGLRSGITDDACQPDHLAAHSAGATRLPTSGGRIGAVEHRVNRAYQLVTMPGMLFTRLVVQIRNASDTAPCDPGHVPLDQLPLHVVDHLPQLLGVELGLTHLGLHETTCCTHKQLKASAERMPGSSAQLLMGQYLPRDSHTRSLAGLGSRASR